MTANDKAKIRLVAMAGAHSPKVNTRKNYLTRLEMRQDRRILNEMGVKSHAWKTSKGWSLSWYCDHEFKTYSMGWNVTEGHKYKTECESCIYAFEFSDLNPNTPEL